MSQKFKALCLACCLVVLTPVLAVNPDLQASLSGWSGHTVTVLVHNLTSSPVSGRVSIDVMLSDSSLSTLTSANFTVAGGATISVALSASQSLAAIDDNPEPIGTVE